MGTSSLTRSNASEGGRTLRDEFDKVAAHNEHHLSQVRLALGRPAA